MKVLGVDLGERRIGLAVSDSAGVLATPYRTLVRSARRADDHEALCEVVEEVGARKVVVGLPLSLGGRETGSARAARAEIAELEAVLGDRGVTVEAFDERLTTVTAHRQLQGAGIGSRKRRQVVDQSAAAVLLQAWLDQRAGG